MSTGGEVANALVCKISIRGFNSRPVLQTMSDLKRFRVSRINFLQAKIRSCAWQLRAAQRRAGAEARILGGGLLRHD